MKLPFVVCRASVCTLLDRTGWMPEMLADEAAWRVLVRYDAALPAPCRVMDVTNTMGSRPVANPVYLRLMSGYVRLVSLAQEPGR